MFKVGILYICTGTYVEFWEEFYKSSEEKLLTECEKHYYVFTDAEYIYGENECERIHRIYQSNLGWPGNTLYRYHIFVKNRSVLRHMDYLFFMNANIIVNHRVKADEFLPVKEALLFVQHPLYYDKPEYDFAYERRKKSTAYIPFGIGKMYICGGCNGGEAEAFLKMAEAIAHNIDVDDRKKVTALWHDESHINRYLVDCDKKSTSYKILDPGYCYPEDFELPFDNMLYYRKKEKYFNVTGIKKHQLTYSERIVNLLILMRKKLYIKMNSMKKK